MTRSQSEKETSDSETKTPVISEQSQRKNPETKRSQSEGKRVCFTTVKSSEGY